MGSFAFPRGVAVLAGAATLLFCACSLRSSLDYLVSECDTAADCPAPTNACFVAACNVGVCGQSLDASVVLDDPIGNCTKLVCGETGAPLPVEDPSDTVALVNAQCREPSCTGGELTQSFKDTGTPCDDGYCDGEGHCVECTGEDDCAGGDSCQDFQCVPPHCTDHDTTGDETAEDCGGMDCAPCADGQTCGIDADCTSGVCEGTCQAPSCDDETLNQDETDVDCGGASCGGCAAGAGCFGPADCASSVCGFDTGDGVCAEASCIDGVKNHGEGDIDCGAVCSQKLCQPKAACNDDNDCFGNECRAHFCVPNCFDRVQDNDEKGVDCGGSCGQACAIPVEPVTN